MYYSEYDFEKYVDVLDFLCNILDFVAMGKSVAWRDVAIRDKVSTISSQSSVNEVILVNADGCHSCKWLKITELIKIWFSLVSSSPIYSVTG